MPIEVRWYDDDHSIMMLIFSREWTTEEFFASVDELVSMAQSVAHAVYLLGHVPPGAPLPPNFLSMINKALERLPPSIVLIVPAGAHMMARSIMSALMRLRNLHGRMTIAPSIEEGLRLIEAHKRRRAD